MDFLILKINGQDLQHSTHEQAMAAFQTAREPIVVEICRRDWSQCAQIPSEKQNGNGSARPLLGRTLGVQTDVTAEETALAVAMTAAALTTEDIRAALHLGPHGITSSETVYSSSVSGLVDIAELDTEADSDERDCEALFPPDGFNSEEQTVVTPSNAVSLCPCDRESISGDYPAQGPMRLQIGQSVENGATEPEHVASILRYLEFKEIKLTRSSPNEKFGLTLCYRNADENEDLCEIYVGEIEDNTVASKNADLKPGDRIVQIGSELVQSRSQVVELFSHATRTISFLVARHVARNATHEALDPDRADSMSHLPTGQDGAEFVHFERPDQDSGLGRTTDESARTEESSEQELESDHKASGLEDDLKRQHYPAGQLCQHTAPEASAEHQIYHPLEHIDEELLNVGRLMQSLAVHCRQLVRTKLKYQATQATDLDELTSRDLEDRPHVSLENCSNGSNIQRHSTEATLRTDCQGNHLVSETVRSPSKKCQDFGPESEKTPLRSTHSNVADLVPTNQTSPYSNGVSTKNPNQHTELRLQLWKQHDLVNRGFVNPNRCTVAPLSDLGGSLFSLAATISSIPSPQPNTSPSPGQQLKSCFSPSSNWSIDESLRSAKNYPNPSTASQPIPLRSPKSPSVSSSSRDGLVTLPGASESGSDCPDRGRPSGISNLSSADSLNQPVCNGKRFTALAPIRTITMEATTTNPPGLMTRPLAWSPGNQSYRRVQNRITPDGVKQTFSARSSEPATSRDHSAHGPTRGLVDPSSATEQRSTDALVHFTPRSIQSELPKPRNNSSPRNQPLHASATVNASTHSYEVYDHSFPTRYFANMAIHRPLPEVTTCQGPVTERFNYPQTTEVGSSDIYETPYASVTLNDEPLDGATEPGTNCVAQNPQSLPLKHFNWSKRLTQTSSSPNSPQFGNPLHQPNDSHAVNNDANAYMLLFRPESNHDVGQYSQGALHLLTNSHSSVMCPEKQPKVATSRKFNYHQVTSSMPRTNQTTANTVMEWVAKKRADGTRYITRRPIRTRVMKQRSKHATEEQRELAATDGSGELSAGRHFVRSERRRHADKPKSDKKREMLVRLTGDKPPTSISTDHGHGTQLIRQPMLPTGKFERTSV